MTALSAPQYKLLDPAAVLPARANFDDAGLDLSSIENVTIPAGKRAVLDTGVAVAIPYGQVGLVCPRSGNAAKLGLTVLNAPGIIDSSYRHAIKVILHNTSDVDVNIVVGQRIAQFVITNVNLADAVQVEELPDPASARQGGLGSTGA